MTGSFVLAWTTTAAEYEGACWIMVRDSQRGWELPGGKLEPWQSEDPRIEEVGWCMQIPRDVGWGTEEIERLLSHDWSASKTLGS